MIARLFPCVVLSGTLLLLLGILGGCPLDLFPNPTPTDQQPDETQCPESTVVDVHLFRFDTETNEYLLGDKRSVRRRSSGI